MNRPTLALRVSQQLSLTPQLQQSIRLLQLSTLELSQEVEQMLADNPFLEHAEDADAVDDTEAPGGLEAREEVGGGDEGLGGNAVGEDGRAAETVPVDDRDLSTELGGDESGLISTRATADDDDRLLA